LPPDLSRLTRRLAGGGHYAHRGCTARPDRELDRRLPRRDRRGLGIECDVQQRADGADGVPRLGARPADRPSAAPVRPRTAELTSRIPRRRRADPDLSRLLGEVAGACRC
jgi:hypothetical protein